MLGSLEHTAQAANVLLLDTNLFLDRAVFKDYFSALSNAQIHHLLKHLKPSVPSNVLAQVEKWGTSGNVKNLLLRDELLPYTALGKGGAK